MPTARTTLSLFLLVAAGAPLPGPAFGAQKKPAAAPLRCRLGLSNSGVTVGHNDMDYRVVPSDGPVTLPGTGPGSEDLVPSRTFIVPAWTWYLPKPGAPNDPDEPKRRLELPAPDGSTLVALVDHHVDFQPPVLMITFAWVKDGHVQLRTEASVDNFEQSGTVHLTLPVVGLRATAWMSCRK